MRMSLMKFSIEARHIPGKDLKDADALSRAPWTGPVASDKIMEEEICYHVQTVMDNAPASKDRLETIVKETQKDEILQGVSKYIREGWPTSKRKCAHNNKAILALSSRTDRNKWAPPKRKQNNHTQNYA